ncbi:MAG: hypothetical protein BWK68_00560, partial [Elusimicrobia bacterium A5]
MPFVFLFTYSLTHCLFAAPPDAFFLLSPAADFISTNTKPSFDWGNSDDPDGKGISYTFQYSFFSDFSSYNQIQALSYYSYTFTDTSLTDDNTYYWRAKAIDADGEYTYSESRIIYINVSNASPAAFDLLLPNNETVLKRPTLTWQPSSDPDPPGVIKYTIYYYSYSDFSSSQTIPNLTSPNYTFTSNLTENMTYHWKIAVIDAYTTPATVFSERIFSFYVKPVPPASPSNVKITDGIISWSPVMFDEDGAAIVDFSTYKFYR